MRALRGASCSVIRGKTVRLADVADLPLGPGTDFSPAAVRAARAALLARNLRFNNATGIMRDNTGVLEKYVRASDHKPHKCLEDVMRWEFSRRIRNSASRIERGYKP